MRLPQWNAAAANWRFASHFLASRSCQLMLACSYADDSRGDGGCGSEFHNSMVACVIAASRLPSGLKLTHRTLFVFRPPSVTISEPVETSQSLTVKSLLDDASRYPSGLKLTPVTAPLWPVSSRTSSPDSAFQNRMISSSPADASKFGESGSRQNATRSTAACPENRNRSAADSTSQTRTVLSAPADASHRPFTL